MEQEKRNLVLASILVFYLSLFRNTFSQSNASSKHFLLVHGAGHGAWCWYKLVPLLKSSGYNVTAIDLAASGIDPLQVTDLRSFSDYTRPLREFLASLGPNETVVLVGHSLGGLAISQAMEMFPCKISVAVFVTAWMPGPSNNVTAVVQESLSQGAPLQDSRTIFNATTNDTTYIFGPMYLKSAMYQLSPYEDWVLATTLVRPVVLFNNNDLSREVNLTKANYGLVKRVFIVTQKDLTIKRSLQEWMIQRNPPNEVKEIIASDHMAMMSKTRQLWAYLVQIARRY